METQKRKAARASRPHLRLYRVRARVEGGVEELLAYRAGSAHGWIIWLEAHADGQLTGDAVVVQPDDVLRSVPARSQPAHVPAAVVRQSDKLH